MSTRTGGPVYGDGTRSVRAGIPAPVSGQPILPGPVLASQYHLPAGLQADPAGQPHPPGQPDPAGRPNPVGQPHPTVLDTYGRTSNPTWRALEAAIGELEGGECVVFSSGLAAISAVLAVLGRPGSVVELPADGYFGTRRLPDAVLTDRQIDVRLVRTAGAHPVAEGTSLILLETPANPSLDVCDIAAISGRAHAAGALVAVDNTTCTPLGQRPLDLGADVSVASGTKALTGHSDLVLGYVCGRDPELVDRIRAWRASTGAVLGPLEAWLAHRSLATLELRLDRQERNAAALARLLAEHPAVPAVRWPGLAGDPSFTLACRQMHRMPGLVTFTLADRAAVDRVLAASRLIGRATSFGGLHTMADRRAQWGDDVPAGLVRLSCGVENTKDLVADLKRALRSLG